MSWTIIYTAAMTAGEPAEGEEYAYGQQEWQGEAAEISYDETYDRMPRVQIDAENIVAGTVVVTLKEGRRVMELTDYTDEPEAAWYESWPIPEPYECYLHRRQGDEYNEAWLYFSPSMEGQLINIECDYYEPDARIKTFVVCPDGTLGVNEAGPRHRFLTVAGSTVAVDYSPRFGDTALEAACLAGDRVFGISSPSWMLVSRGNYWTGYVSVPVIGKDRHIWSIAAELARAGDCYLFAQGFSVILRNRDSYPETSELQHELEATAKSLTPYKTVTMSYANGEVSTGEGKPIFNVSAPYVWDKGHAEALCASAYEYYREERKEYTVRCTGILDDEVLLAKKLFTFEDESVAGHIKGIKFTATNHTDITVIGEVKPRTKEVNLV